MSALFADFFLIHPSRKNVIQTRKISNISLEIVFVQSTFIFGEGLFLKWPIKLGEIWLFKIGWIDNKKMNK